MRAATLSKTRALRIRVVPRSGRASVCCNSTSARASAAFCRASSVAVLATRNPQLGEAAVKQLHEKEGLSNVVFYPLDLNSPESIQAFASSMEKDYGRVDTLVNNAGET